MGVGRTRSPGTEGIGGSSWKGTRPLRLGRGSSTGEEGREAAKIQGSRPLASSFIRICSYEPAPKFQILYLFNKRPDFNKKRPSGFGK